MTALHRDSEDRKIFKQQDLLTFIKYSTALSGLLKLALRAASTSARVNPSSVIWRTNASSLKEQKHSTIYYFLNM